LPGGEWAMITDRNETFLAKLTGKNKVQYGDRVYVTLGSCRDGVWFALYDAVVERT